MEETNNGDGRAKKNKHHFVLVHGLCHGAWCWYKAATALRRAGHRVTAPDMAGCGAHPARLAEVRTFEEYSRPLLDAVAALPPGERAVLVGHSHGGCGVALAAERFPEKVAAAVFVAASMPAVGRSMGAATTDEVRQIPGRALNRVTFDLSGNAAACRKLHVINRPDFFLDTKVLDQENPDIPGHPVIFGPKFVAQRLYQLSPPEVSQTEPRSVLLLPVNDLTLALSLIRPANRFNEDPLMKDENLLTEAGYGSVRRVFVVVEDDLGIPAEFQRRMIALSPAGVEVEAMDAGGADHMAMLSRPEELVERLIRIADNCVDGRV
ncbi:hypothetical protein HU200_008345 [Digitaria exilis]|uniref:AB hydrolase-1 domain-containing protein n=1 Tax=Digitaria exilis TaxID=1010633 RepID=A0A835FPE9_9POAL|nr:hypothetical protein HU200_008345 [Digitaria exilis]